jgi:site-specific recombinase XerD
MGGPGRNEGHLIRSVRSSRRRVAVAPPTWPPDYPRSASDWCSRPVVPEGCGLRIEEALAVHREDFRSPRTLRLTGQASRDGREKVPLKHRKRGEYRDVIMPAWLGSWSRTCPKARCALATTVRTLCTRPSGANSKAAARSATIPAGFRAHSLRHAFASTLLSRGVPITDVPPLAGSQGHTRDL